MENNIGDLDALIQEKIDADNDFQTSLADMSDDDRNAAIEARKNELVRQEYKSLSEKAKKDAEIANNYKIRAEKAEQSLKKPNSADGEKTPKNDGGELSSKDIIALSKANIADEDIDEVLDYAKYKKISVAEALKSSVVKATLAEKEEFRKTAAATNAGAGRRGQSQVSGETLLDNARNGQLPESDDDINSMVKARLQSKRGK